MFFQPHTIEEVLQLKREHGAEATLIAGGTDLIVMMNHGRAPARIFVDLTHVPGMDSVDLLDTPEGKQYLVGGAATFAQLAELPVKALAEASLSVGGPQIRNRGTIGGNLASASPAGDGSTALLALDADIELQSSTGRRWMPLRDFFLDYRKTALAPDEIIRTVRFPADWRSGWKKLGKRGAMNISLVCCAVAVSPAGKYCVAFGSVGPYPMRAYEAEKFLSTQEQVDEILAEQAAQIAAREVRPIDDFRGSAEYRRAMAGALLKKALREME